MTPSTAYPRILLVEDDADFREAVRDMLYDRGFLEVTEASDGLDGVQIVQTSEPDVVVMDVRMPRLGGIEAVQVMRRIRPDLPIVLLTAYDDAGIKREALAAGVTGYLLKGCPPASIMVEIMRAWGKGDPGP